MKVTSDPLRETPTVCSVTLPEGLAQALRDQGREPVAAPGRNDGTHVVASNAADTTPNASVSSASEVTSGGRKRSTLP